MKKILFLLLLFVSTVNAQTDLWGGRTATQGKTFLSLGNVENTALSTWAGTSNITTLGTIGTGTWNGSLITGTYGGTGVNNGSSTITLAANLITAGANSLTLTTTGTTDVTLPTSGTLVNTAVTTLSSLVSIGTVTTGTWNATTIDVAHGGTGVTTMTTAYAPVISGTTATGALQVASTGLSTSGYVLTSNGASAVPSFQAPTGGYSIATITADQTGAVNNQYVNNKAVTRLVVTLPGTAAVGDKIRILGLASNGWKIAQPASVAIHWSGNSSTTGTGGYLQSNSQYDVVEVECVVANTEWNVVVAQGQLTIN